MSSEANTMTQGSTVECRFGASQRLVRGVVVAVEADPCAAGGAMVTVDAGERKPYRKALADVTEVK